MYYIVEMNNVSKAFKGFSVSNMSLKIPQGYVTGFIGANGAGKSTTIKMMMNLLKPDSGSVRLFGQSYDQHEKAIKQRIGFVYDGNVFFEGLNVKDIKRIVAPAYKQWDDTQFKRYIEQFELPWDKPVKTFSKGMKMKASLAIALSHHAELIIMDEPTAGLDPVFRRELLDLLHDIMADGKRTLFFSTHITTDLDRIADYIAFIRKGQLIFNQTIHEVADSYALVKGRNDLLDRDTEQLFLHIRRTPTGFEALTSQRSAVQKLFGDQAVIDTASLEDIMFHMKEEAQHA